MKKIRTYNFFANSSTQPRKKHNLTRSVRLSKLLTFVGLLFCGLANAQLLQQQFSTNEGTLISAAGSVTSGTYFNSTAPTTAQFNRAEVLANYTISSDGSILQWTKTSTGVTGIISRTTNLAASAPASLIIKADVTLTSVTTGATPALTFYAGQNFQATGTSAPTTANIHSLFRVNLTSNAGGTWGSLSNTSVAKSVTKTITWVINNSGGVLSYKAPNGTFETVGNDSYDLWLGNTRDRNDSIATTASAALQNFAILFGGGVTAFQFDNILIDPIPSVPTSTAATSVASTGFTANWDAVAGASGYRIDVATDAAFTSIVSAYNDIDAGNSTSLPIIGLDPATTYYYRIRAYNAYAVATNTSGNSDAQTATTSTVLPVTFTSLNVSQIGNSNVVISWSVASDIEVVKYEIEKSNATSQSDFKYFGSQLAIADGGQHNYTYTDASGLSGTYLYRLKAIEKDGSIRYSNVVKISIGVANLTKVQVYPNPTIGSKVNLQLSGLSKDHYEISVFDVTGRKLTTNSYSYEGGNASINLHVPFLVPGTYRVKVESKAQIINTNFLVVSNGAQ